jgi:hypothetical protein
MTNEKFSMTNFQFMPSALVAAGRAAAFAFLRLFLRPVGLYASHTEVRVRQTARLSSPKSLTPPGFYRKYFEMNDLQQIQPLAGSKSIKVNQTGLRVKWMAVEDVKNCQNRPDG